MRLYICTYNTRFVVTAVNNAFYNNIFLKENPINVLFYQYSHYCTVYTFCKYTNKNDMNAASSVSM